MSDEQAGMGLAGFIGAMRADPGRTLVEVLAGVGRPDRAERKPDPPDPDERAANLMAAGVQPGAVSQLAQRYGDTLAELETVRSANEAARTRAGRVWDMHTRGQITAFDIANMDLAEPDPAAEERLERRAESLRAQMLELQSLIAPQEQRRDPVQDAASRAQRAMQEYVAGLRAEDDRREAQAAEAMRRDRAAFFGRRGGQR
jgi:hypothetical protein